jgi:hypothetical protein
MEIKRVLMPERLRETPRQFGWIDRRVVREGYIERCDAQAWALSVFLATVADAQGPSYYREALLARHLSMATELVVQALADLVRAGLIAYQAPIYQVLSLEAPSAPPEPGMRSLPAGIERLQRRCRETRASARDWNEAR